MKIEILTLFPQMCESVLGESIIGRARQSGKVEIHCTDIRAYTADKHRRVDDTPYGGGMGMVMQAQLIYDCYEAVCRQFEQPPHLVYMTPQGAPLTQSTVKRLAAMDGLVILCGHYEGVDERVIEALQPEEISVGDYVLTGGELPALVLADAVSRLQPGVLADESCYEEESHYDSLLEYPQYTRPFTWQGRDVPEVLISGNHAKIKQWRREQSILRTAFRRPDMLQTAELSDEERRFLQANGPDCGK